MNGLKIGVECGGNVREILPVTTWIKRIPCDKLYKFNILILQTISIPIAKTLLPHQQTTMCTKLIQFFTPEFAPDNFKQAIMTVL